MEFTIDEASRLAIRVRLEVSRTPLDSVIRDLHAAATSISFVAMIAGTEYAFTGHKENNEWSGRLRNTRNARDTGTWKLARVREDGRYSTSALPAPTGPFRVGRTTFDWTDTARAELETRGRDDRRRVMVYLFYPADTGATKAEYMPDAEVMRSAWGTALTDRVKALGSYSFKDAPIAGGAAQFPVVLFLPGGSQKVLSYTTLLEDLASQGYVVAAIEPAYNAPAMHFPDGTIFNKLPLAERSWEVPSTLSIWLRNHQGMAVQWAHDVRFVIDQLATLDRGSGLLARRLDLNRVGVFGHSFGGQAAGTARLVDRRVRGAINLDGNETGTAFDYVTDKDAGEQPFLWIEGPYEPPTEAGLKASGLTRAQWDDMYRDGDRQMRGIRNGALRVAITRVGIDHMDFSDQPYWNTSLTSEDRAGKLRTLEFTRAYISAFFDGCLRDEWRRMRRLVGEAGGAWPEVTVHRYGPLPVR